MKKIKLCFTFPNAMFTFAHDIVQPSCAMLQDYQSINFIQDENNKTRQPEHTATANAAKAHYTKPQSTVVKMELEQPVLQASPTAARSYRGGGGFDE